MREPDQTVVKIEGMKLEHLSDGSKVIFEEYELEEGEEEGEEIEIPVKQKKKLCVTLIQNKIEKFN